MARRGIPGFLIGDTAERVLRVVDTLRNDPATFVAILVIALLAIVLDFTWKRGRPLSDAGSGPAGGDPVEAWASMKSFKRKPDEGKAGSGDDAPRPDHPSEGGSCA